MDQSQNVLGFSLVCRFSVILLTQTARQTNLSWNKAYCNLTLKIYQTFIVTCLQENKWVFFHHLTHRLWPLVTACYRTTHLQVDIRVVKKSKYWLCNVKASRCAWTREMLRECYVQQQNQQALQLCSWAVRSDPDFSSAQHPAVNKTNKNFMHKFFRIKDHHLLTPTQ